MIRPGQAENTTAISLLAGNVSTATTGADYATKAYCGKAWIVLNPAVTSSTDSTKSPSYIVTLKTGTDTALTVATTLKTFDTVDTGSATMQEFELDMALSKGYIRADVAVTDTTGSTCPVSLVGLFPLNNW